MASSSEYGNTNSFEEQVYDNYKELYTPPDSSSSENVSSSSEHDSLHGIYKDEEDSKFVVKNEHLARLKQLQTTDKNPLSDITNIIIDKVLEKLSKTKGNIEEQINNNDTQINENTENAINIIENIDKNANETDIPVDKTVLKETVSAVLNNADLDSAGEQIHNEFNETGQLTPAVTNLLINTINNNVYNRNKSIEEGNRRSEFFRNISQQLENEINKNRLNSVTKKDVEQLKYVFSNTADLLNSNNGLKKELTKIEETMTKINISFKLYLNENALYISNIIVNVYENQENPDETNIADISELLNNKINGGGASIDNLIDNAIGNNSFESVTDISKYYETYKSNEPVNKKNVKELNETSVVKISYNLFLKGTTKLYINFEGISSEYLKLKEVFYPINSSNSLEIISNIIKFQNVRINKQNNLLNNIKTAYNTIKSSSISSSQITNGGRRKTSKKSKRKMTKKKRKIIFNKKQGKKRKTSKK